MLDMGPGEKVQVQLPEDLCSTRTAPGLLDQTCHTFHIESLQVDSLTNYDSLESPGPGINIHFFGPGLIQQATPHKLG